MPLVHLVTMELLGPRVLLVLMELRERRDRLALRLSHEIARMPQGLVVMG
ncbi:hypothetical protein KBY79_12205 [Synechococcus lacustris C3-12m-Tous]|nr:hypothetical protein [Synechococcus lacustris]MCP9925970.1 hypothetical protein [Synechococcus lacustris C3-12m-Tous]